MHTGSDIVETWIPDGGFKIERRKIRTPDGDLTTFRRKIHLGLKWQSASPVARRLSRGEEG
jgi:hypothetical protein